jgi:REP element-mobilizing transposase RayT
MTEKRHDYLRRLSPEWYRGKAYGHWSMTIENRRTGWLTPILHCRFREILTHAALRYGLCCPIYCCMPDHLHLLWTGLLACCDQRNAARFFRREFNLVLVEKRVELQKQPHDHVLRDEERGFAAFEAVAEYIARNPERRGLVPADGYRDYQYTGCLVPGYPSLSPWQDDYWEKFWRLYSRLSTHGLHTTDVEPSGNA